MPLKRVLLLLIIVLFVAIVGSETFVSFFDQKRYAVSNEIPEQEVIIDGSKLLIETTTLPQNTTWEGEVYFGESSYVYASIRDISPIDLSLVGNYQKKIMTIDFINDNNCRFVVNGGFYDTDYLPLGWVNIEGKDISNNKISNLFNGYVAILEDGIISISKNKPENGVVFGLQSGPMLISDSNVQILNMARDRNSRRVVMVQDFFGRVAFFIFFSKQSDQLGPMLTELPELVLKACREKNINVVNAINLDGGGASVFYDGQIFLKEKSSVGGWWCVK